MSSDETTRQNIRAAKLTIESTPEGATLVIEAGKLRLRFYIDGQWSDLLQQLHSSDEEAGDMVPFKMRPIPASSVTGSDGEENGEAVISTATIGAHPIPGLSKQNPAYETPLWESTFPSLQTEEGGDQETT